MPVLEYIDGPLGSKFARAITASEFFWDVMLDHVRGITDPARRAWAIRKLIDQKSAQMAMLRNLQAHLLKTEAIKARAKETQPM